MIQRACALINFLFVLAFCNLHAAESFVIADMQALIKQEGYIELLEKADKVSPSQRNEEWENLVLKAAKSLVEKTKQIAGKDSSMLRDVALPLEDAEKKFPFLQKNPDYNTAKGKSLVESSALCLKNDDLVCGQFIERLASSALSFPKGGAKTIALLIGKASGNSIHFWLLATQDDRSTCSDKTMSDQLISNLGSASKTSEIMKARKLVTLCYGALENQIKGRVNDARPKSQFLKNVCPAIVGIPNQTVFIKKKCAESGDAK